MECKGVADTSRKIGRPPVDRRREILDAAERLHDELGFEKTTMADIAKALAMSPANLYRTFPNRRAIDDAIAERRLKTIEDIAWAEARRASQDPEAAFLSLVACVSTATVDVLFTQGRASDLCIAAARGHWPVVSRFLQELHGALRHVIAEGQRLGAFDDKLKCDETADTLIGTLMRVWHPLVLDATHAIEIGGTADRIGTFLLRALKSDK